MEMLSVLGIILAVLAVFSGHHLEGGQISALVNMPALIIVLGGTTGAVLLQTPQPVFKRALQQLRWVFNPPKLSPESLLRKIVLWSRAARAEGFIVLENNLEIERDPFTYKGLDALTQGCNAQTLREILEVEMSHQEAVRLQAANVFTSMGGYSPTIGIIGAVLGLIHVMNRLTQPDEIGGGIAVAFVATIYGVGFANLLFIPIANKMKTIATQHYVYQEMITEGLVAIAKGEHPRIIEKRLRGFIKG